MSPYEHKRRYGKMNYGKPRSLGEDFFYTNNYSLHGNMGVPPRDLQRIWIRRSRARLKAMMIKSSHDWDQLALPQPKRLINLWDWY